MPCLVGTFDHPAPTVTQKTIAFIGASLAEVEKQIAHSDGALLDVDSQNRVAREFERQMDALLRAHELNTQGSTNDANNLLAATFGKPIDGYFVWPGDRPFVYAHHAVESVRACIDDNATNVEVECGTSILTTVLSRGELHPTDIEKRLDGIKAIQPASLIALYNQQNSDHNSNQQTPTDPGNSGGGPYPENDPEKDPLPVDNTSIMGHMFRNAVGHMEDTSENRQLLRDLVRDVKNFVGKDAKWMRRWYSRIESDGTQLWAEVRNGIVRNGGRNKTPEVFNAETGLYKPVRPNIPGR
jgi:hypothetical protein